MRKVYSHEVFPYLIAFVIPVVWMLWGLRIIELPVVVVVTNITILVVVTYTIVSRRFHRHNNIDNGSDS